MCYSVSGNRVHECGDDKGVWKVNKNKILQQQQQREEEKIGNEIIFFCMISKYFGIFES